MAHINGNKILFGNMRQVQIPYDSLLYTPETPDIPQEILDIVEDICNHYDLDIDNCYFLGTQYYRFDNAQYNVAVTVKPTLPSARLLCGQFGTSNGWQGLFLSSNNYCYNSINGYSQGQNSVSMISTLNGSNDWVQPFPFYGNVPLSEIESCFTIVGDRYYSPTFEQAITYNP